MKEVEMDLSENVSSIQFKNGKIQNLQPTSYSMGKN